jgi:hypothetical protein
MEDWPLEPIALYSNSPFHFGGGYILGGCAETPLQYLEYCIQCCKWSERRYRPKGEQELRETLDAFVKSMNRKYAVKGHKRIHFAPADFIDQISPHQPLSITPRTDTPAFQSHAGRSS